MFRFLRHHSVKVLLGLGLWTTAQGLLSAQPTPALPAAMSPQPVPPPAVPVPPAPTQPAPVAPMAPAAPPAGQGTSIATMPGPAPAYGPWAPWAMAPYDPYDYGQGADLSHGPAPADDHEAQAPTKDKEWLGCNDVLSAVTMFGYGNALNNFNIFNNMNALPQNRVWYGYSSLSDFRTGFGDHGPPNLPTAQYRIVQLQNVGAEIALGNLGSLVVQGQYVQSTATTDNANAWANPQALLKWAAYYTEDTIFSPVLGVQIQTPQSAGQLHERSSRVMGGFLFYQALCGDWLFLQGGAQLSVPTSNAATTLDYGLSLGWWLYRDDSLDFAGRRTYSWERVSLPFVTGVLPMLELWGQNVLTGGSQAPFTPALPDPTVQYPPYGAARNVYTLTAGVRFLLYNHFSLGLAYSCPLTGSQVYSDGFLATLNVNF